MTQPLLSDLAINAFRDYNTIGDPSSGGYSPVKADIRTPWFHALDKAYMCSLLQANMHAVGDNLFDYPFDNNYYWRITKITAVMASVDISSTLQVGVFTSTGGGGTALVTPQGLTNNTGLLKATDLTLNAPGLVLPASQNIYLRVTTPFGSAAVCDFYIFGDIYGESAAP